MAHQKDYPYEYASGDFVGVLISEGENHDEVKAAAKRLRNCEVSPIRCKVRKLPASKTSFVGGNDERSLLLVHFEDEDIYDRHHRNELEKLSVFDND